MGPHRLSPPAVNVVQQITAAGGYLKDRGVVGVADVTSATMRDAVGADTQLLSALCGDVACTATAVQRRDRHHDQHPLGPDECPELLQAVGQGRLREDELLLLAVTVHVVGVDVVVLTIRPTKN